MAALKKNDTWQLVPVNPGKKIVLNGFFFSVKQKADGTVGKYTAMLIAKGFTQTYSIGYLETFAPVTKMNTIRAFLSCAVKSRMEPPQLDVTNAFLHGGFSSQTTEGKVEKGTL